MKTERTIFDAINEIVGWYSTLPADYNHVHELMHNRDQLAGYFYTLCAEVGELRIDWNRSQATRENNRLKLMHKFITQGQNVSKAEMNSKLNTQKELEIEKQAEGMYFGYKESIDAVREVLQAMNQRIAHARSEWEQMRFMKQSTT